MESARSGLNQCFRRGLIQKYKQGREVESGTIRINLDRPVYLDGTAKHVGTNHAQAASAIVQFDEEGEELAWAMAMLEGYPISAVSAKHMTVLL